VDAHDDLARPTPRVPSGARAASLEEGTQLSGHAAGWVLGVCKAAGEAVTFFRGKNADPADAGKGSGATTPEENRERSARRAATNLRRYCKANRLDRLATLTYRVAQFDKLDVKRDLNRFFVRLRKTLGVEALPYAYALERHESGALHVHVAFGQFIEHWVLVEAWSHGICDIRAKHRRGGRGAGGGHEKARRVAGYLSKYVGKALEAGEGRHSYETGQGFKPEWVRSVARSEHEALGMACREMDGTVPDHVWSSDGVADWRGPPTRVAFFDGGG